MYDRKPDNLLVGIDRKAKNNEKVYFVEADFDNNIVNQKVIHCIFNYNTKDENNKDTNTNIKDENNKDTKTDWDKHLEQLVKQYEELKEWLQKNNKLNTWNENLKKLVAKYTMTIDKIKNVIIKTTINAKYMDMNEVDIIKNLEATICRWKKMLKDEENGNIIKKIPYIEEARTRTLEELKKIKDKDIKDIVNNVMTLQHSCDDRIYNKDDFNINYKNKQETNNKSKQETNNIKKLTNDDFYINYTTKNREKEKETKVESQQKNKIGSHFKIKNRHNNKKEKTKKEEEEADYDTWFQKHAENSTTQKQQLKNLKQEDKKKEEYTYERNNMDYKQWFQKHAEKPTTQKQQSKNLKQEEKKVDKKLEIKEEDKKLEIKENKNEIKKEREAQEKQNAERIKRDYKEIKVGGNTPMKFTKVNFKKIKEIIEEANKKKNKKKTRNKKSKKNTKTLNQGNKKGF